LVVFKVKHEEKRILIRSLSKRGYTLHKDWVGEALAFQRDENGTIELDNKKYYVYYISEENYLSQKKKNSGKGVVSTTASPLSLEEFERFFKEGHI